MTEIIDHELMRKTNQLRILQAIREYAPMTRKELQSTTQLSWGTITSVSKELIAKEIIKEVGVVQSAAGRKAINLDMNCDSNHVIGVRIGGRHLKVNILNILGEKVADSSTDIDPSSSLEVILKNIFCSIDRLLVESSLTIDKIAGIGIAAPGVVNNKMGICVYSPHHESIRNWPLKQLIEERYHKPCFIDHVNNCAAMGENWFGYGKGKTNFLQILLGAGISAGIFLNGEVYGGHNNTAGEFGHICMVENGASCVCGRKGCLELYASGNAITAKGKELVLTKNNTKLLSLAENNIENITGETVYKAALEGDKESRELLETVGFYLGNGISHLINLFNPELVILSGRVAQANEFFMPSLKKQVEQRGWNFASHEMKISKLDDAGLLGADAIVLNEIYYRGLIL